MVSIVRPVSLDCSSQASACMVAMLLHAVLWLVDFPKRFSRFRFLSRLAGKSITKMTYFVSHGTLNFNSVNQSINQSSYLLRLLSISVHRSFDRCPSTTTTSNFQRPFSIAPYTGKTVFGTYGIIARLIGFVHASAFVWTSYSNVIFSWMDVEMFLRQIP